MRRGISAQTAYAAVRHTQRRQARRLKRLSRKADMDNVHTMKSDQVTGSMIFHLGRMRNVPPRRPAAASHGAPELFRHRLTTERIDVKVVRPRRHDDESHDRRIRSRLPPCPVDAA